MNHIYKKTILLLICSLHLFAFSQSMKVFNLVARQSGTATMWDGQLVELWGFKEGLGGNVELPSPLLEVNEGGFCYHQYYQPIQYAAYHPHAWLGCQSGK